MKPSISIIGAGASALFFASKINSEMYDIQIFEQKRSLGRKLLVAGKGGFNLSHSESTEQLIERYQPKYLFESIIQKYPSEELRHFFNTIKIPTYIGSSKRIFPEKLIKPIDVLTALQQNILSKNIQIHTNHQWTGWDKNNNKTILFKSENKTFSKTFDYIIFALGGGSWKITGSDGHWLNIFKANNIKTQPFQASNCAMKVNWDTQFIKNSAGTPLKNIAVSFANNYNKGELMITEFGLEGASIYALSFHIRNCINLNNNAIIKLDLKPSLTLDTIIKRLNEKSNLSWTKHIEKQLNFSKIKMRLLKSKTSIETFNSIDLISEQIKGLPIQIENLGPVDEAISTVGGIDLSEINTHFELNSMPNQFTIGEMLDWDAPTGGYLIQACFSMGFYLADYFNTLKH